MTFLKKKLPSLFSLDHPNLQVGCDELQSYLLKSSYYKNQNHISSLKPVKYARKLKTYTI